jgi:hypothetical protein
LNLRQGSQRGRNAVQLPAAMIRDGDRRCPFIDGPTRVVARQDSLHDDRTAPAVTDPTQVGPRHRGARQGGVDVDERHRPLAGKGFAGLVVTIDTPVSGIRELDYRNGMKELLSGNVLEKLRYLPQVLSRPGWLVGFLLDGGLRPLPNVIPPAARALLMTASAAARPPIR